MRSDLKQCGLPVHGACHCCQPASHMPHVALNGREPATLRCHKLPMLLTSWQAVQPPGQVSSLLTHQHNTLTLNHSAHSHSSLYMHTGMWKHSLTHTLFVSLILSTLSSLSTCCPINRSTRVSTWPAHSATQYPLCQNCTTCLNHW